MREADCCERIGYILLRGKDLLSFKKDVGGKNTSLKQAGGKTKNDKESACLKAVAVQRKAQSLLHLHCTAQSALHCTVTQNRKGVIHCAQCIHTDTSRIS